MSTPSATTGSQGNSHKLVRPGKRRAVIVSIRYSGLERDLHEPDGSTYTWKLSLGGNYETARALRDLLKTPVYGYLEEDITLLLDDGEHLSPTADNILASMVKLVDGAEPGDRFVFYFAGHGWQRLVVDDPDEEDGLDELILPIDFSSTGRYIVDDEIYELLVKRLPPGCRLTGIFDCCHSGTVMDLKHNYQAQVSEDETPHMSILTVEKTPQVLSARGRLRNLTKQGKFKALIPKKSQERDLLRNVVQDASDSRFSKVLNKNVMISSKFGKASQPYRPTHIFGDLTKPLSPRLETEGCEALEPVLDPKLDKTILPSVVLSLGACHDSEISVENTKGEAMGKFLIDFLVQKPEASIMDVLEELYKRMTQASNLYRRYLLSQGSEEPFEGIHPQLGSLWPLDKEAFDTVFTF
ncbi:hypothetical protein SISSUDRAFT_1049068 [Sistotremastrum suecicum HHB10207 ss-3]|uniref:Peptidase C14 caspase domain-containing protein n=1 Tax=Sistotremastrum suecicum HHB10207 ss-3 TaxID=1314776 RepID=A0A166C3I7_9AGAM|nr:hypothetical protein SISSUDRAFT_1049068 [Sistotremastrum suecicum HHB10207 ss-3]